MRQASGVRFLFILSITMLLLNSLVIAKTDKEIRHEKIKNYVENECKIKGLIFKEDLTLKYKSLRHSILKVEKEGNIFILITNKV